MKQWTLFLLSLAGLIFSGYLSGVKFFTSSCALSESCPYVWGYPACYYGFALYLVLTTITFLILFKKVESNVWVPRVAYGAILGMLFAGYFTVGELPLVWEQGVSAFVLGLPTCAWGLLMYIAIFLRAKV